MCCTVLHRNARAAHQRDYSAAPHQRVYNAPPLQAQHGRQHTGRTCGVAPDTNTHHGSAWIEPSTLFCSSIRKDASGEEREELKRTCI
mmetsp:Transcript_23750/g.72613  ORF Transcript_23750/g.72613 Transcript_23750/m.72613 type:complete len:88 (-) Transcript_23750:726-989(-)